MPTAVCSPTAPASATGTNAWGGICPNPGFGYALDTLAYTASSDADLIRRQLLNRLQKREPDLDLRARRTWSLLTTPLRISISNA